jgi:hypothetical protein
MELEECPAQIMQAPTAALVCIPRPCRYRSGRGVLLHLLNTGYNLRTHYPLREYPLP